MQDVITFVCNTVYVYVCIFIPFSATVKMLLMMAILIPVIAITASK